jgi:hypothetical protein
MINPLELVGSIYQVPESVRQSAKRAILQHDPLAADILEILGLGENANI